MTKLFLKILCLLTLVSGGVFAQTVPTANLETILSEAEKQSQNYREEFRNLLADETKTFQAYDKKGQPKDKSVIESTFLVYQSPKRQNSSVELRNILKYNGEVVSDSQKRSEQLLAELQKTTTYEKELDKISKESLRFDKTLEINGLTLVEGVTLARNLREFFDYQLVGTEMFEGKEVYVVSYQQKQKSPYINVGGKNTNNNDLNLDFQLNLPGKLKNSDAFLRGKMWIDTKTYQLLREERELTVLTPTPVVALRTEFLYQPSDYGILLPKEITLTNNNLKKVSDGNQYEPITDTKVKFEYKNFRKTDVDVKIIDDDQ